MFFSRTVQCGRCISCGHNVTRSSSTAVLYYVGLTGFGVAIIQPQFRHAFELMSAWAAWLVSIAIEPAALIACVLLWSVASGWFKENMNKCSKCGGSIEVLSDGFDHDIVPNLDDVVIGLLFVGMQVGILYAMSRLATAS